MRHWIAAPSGARHFITSLGGVALLGHILAVCLLPIGAILPVAVFVAAGVALCAAALALSVAPSSSVSSTAASPTVSSSDAPATRRASVLFSPWFDLPLLAYAAAVALSSWLAPPGGTAYAWRDALWFSVLAMATWRVALDARVRAAALTCVIAALAVLLAGAFGPRSNPDRFGRFFYYPAIAQWGAYPEIGMLGCLGAGASMAMALAARLWRIRIAAAVLSALFALVPMLVLSRGGIIAMAGIAVWLIVVAAIKWRERLVLAVLVAGCLGAGAIAWRYADLARLKSEYGESAAVYAVGERASHWIAGRDMVRDHPWTGVGTGRFKLEFRKYRTDVEPMQHAHNMLLHVAAETGLLALIPFLLIWGRLLLAPLRTPVSGREAVVAFAIHGMIAAFFIRSMTDNFLTNVHSSQRSMLLIAILLGLAEASIRGSRAATVERRLPRNPSS
jgi:O-antigen ligase